jgi:hypothetical protein
MRLMLNPWLWAVLVFGALLVGFCWLLGDLGNVVAMHAVVQHGGRNPTSEWGAPCPGWFVQRHLCGSPW